MGVLKSRRRRQKDKNVREHERSWFNITGLEMEMSQGCGQPLEAKRAKEIAMDGMFVSP